MMGLFEFLYYLGYKEKKKRGLKRQKRLPAKVISVGNITTGGTGKTPFAMALAQEAVRRGFMPVILTRGYKGKAEGLITPGMSEKDAGDEALLMAEKLLGISIIKSRDRYKAGISALRTINEKGGRAPLFILDDGFQHWRLFRDKDIVLINAVNPFDSGKLLPMGHLREPMEEIKRADIIVLTKSYGIYLKPLIDEIRKYNPLAPVFASSHVPSHFVTVRGERISLEELKGMEVYGFAGIAEPGPFMADIERCGLRLRGFRSYGDHYRYKQGDLRRLARDAARSGARWIITTEKDIIRLKTLDFPENLAALAMEIKIDEGFYDEVFREV